MNNKKKFKKILIMGLPGSGKTTLAKLISKKLKLPLLNADVVRKKYNDWDFSLLGRIRQAKRMDYLANLLIKKEKKDVLVDFVCPTKDSLKNFRYDLLIWMDTIKESRFQNINKIFKKPKKYSLRVLTKDSNLWFFPVVDLIKPYIWKDTKPTVQMLGRFQPWHLGHRKLFEKTLLRNNQVNIQVKDMKQNKNNPYNFSYIKKSILEDLKIYKQRFKITKVPNIMEICYGRTVGYKFKKIKLTKQLHKISATKLRKKMKSLKNQHEV